MSWISPEFLSEIWVGTLDSSTFHDVDHLVMMIGLKGAPKWLRTKVKVIYSEAFNMCYLFFFISWLASLWYNFTHCHILAMFW